MSLQYNSKSPGVRRILSELKELTANPNHDFVAHPLNDNLYEWHFTIKGPTETEFEGGRYHGRILLPSEYPFKPPNIILLTPNGRFELLKKICLSITGYHPEYWQPAWGVRTAILALISFFPTKADGAIGGIDWNPEERKVLAKESLNWTCPTCSVKMMHAFDHLTNENVARTAQPAVDLSMFSFSYSKEGLKSNPDSPSASTPESTRVSVPASSSSKLANDLLRQRVPSLLASDKDPTTSTPTTPTQLNSSQTRKQPHKGFDIAIVIVFAFLGLILLKRLLSWLGPHDG